MHYKNHLVEEKCEGTTNHHFEQSKDSCELVLGRDFCLFGRIFFFFFHGFVAFIQSRWTGVCVKVCRCVRLKTAHKCRVVPLMCQTHQVLNFCTRLMMILCYSLCVPLCCPSRSSM